MKKFLSGSTNSVLGLIGLRLVKKSNWKTINDTLEHIYSEQENNREYFGLGKDKLLNMFFQLLLEREPDIDGKNYYTGWMEEGATAKEVITSILHSEEFIEKYLKDVAFRFGDETIEKFNYIIKNAQIPFLLHKVRTSMVQNLLPEAKHILDLGGADSTDPRGALLSHGYPHEPQEVSIVDLPPKERYEPVTDATDGKDTLITGPTTVKYYYQSMADLSNFPDDYFDLVWCGESIEHISIADAGKMIPDIQRILRKGGYFCFDTPNRSVTELQVGKNGFIHPEHKHEYMYDEMKNLLKLFDMKIVKTKGLVNMKKSIRKNEFLIDEFIDEIEEGLNTHPESSYLFYFCLRK